MTNQITTESVLEDLRYLQLLARNFPTIADASTEIINLEAILNLPKGTEHFLSDIHGEDQAFSHVLKNASGAVKRKVNEIFTNSLRESEKGTLYPHLLSSRKVRVDQIQREGSGGLVPSHVEPAGEGVPKRLLQIHPLESAQGSPDGIFLYHPGAPA